MVKIVNRIPTTLREAREALMASSEALQITPLSIPIIRRVWNPTRPFALTTVRYKVPHAAYGDECEIKLGGGKSHFTWKICAQVRREAIFPRVVKDDSCSFASTNIPNNNNNNHSSCADVDEFDECESESIVASDADADDTNCADSIVVDDDCDASSTETTATTATTTIDPTVAYVNNYGRVVIERADIDYGDDTIYSYLPRSVETTSHLEQTAQYNSEQLFRYDGFETDEGFSRMIRDSRRTDFALVDLRFPFTEDIGNAIPHFIFKKGNACDSLKLKLKLAHLKKVYVSTDYKNVRPYIRDCSRQLNKNDVEVEIFCKVLTLTKEDMDYVNTQMQENGGLRYIVQEYQECSVDIPRHSSCGGGGSSGGGGGGNRKERCDCSGNCDCPTSFPEEVIPYTIDLPFTGPITELRMMPQQVKFIECRNFFCYQGENDRDPIVGYEIRKNKQAFLPWRIGKHGRLINPEQHYWGNTTSKNIYIECFTPFPYIPDPQGYIWPNPDKYELHIMFDKNLGDTRLHLAARAWRIVQFSIEADGPCVTKLAH